MPLKIRLISLILRSVALTPLTTQRWLGKRIGSLMWRWDKRSARICRTNIALCYPELNDQQRESLCRDSLQNTGMAFAELGCCYYWSANKIRHCVSFKDEDVLAAATAEGKGVILATPHFGNWELIGQYLAIEHTMHVLYKPAKDKGTDAYIFDRRSRFGTQLLPTNASGVRGLSRALKKGDIVGILPDQEPDRDGGVFAPFFNRQALTMTLLSKLASRKKVPVLLTYMRRTDAGFSFHLKRLDDSLYQEDLSASTTALNASIEALVRQYPEHYIWNYKRFATQPDSMPRLYR